MITDPINFIEGNIESSLDINPVNEDSKLPQQWNPSMKIQHVSEAKTLTLKPPSGKSYLFSILMLGSFARSKNERKIPLGFLPTILY